ncbi:aminotransferase class V-fold PLP-dependent enzyme [Alicyclobacillus sp.]|uniref:pyridoxal phosphate-dependent decarboxylase family protein n=1 Tax=Alicyclobacillus sp. TaxID=61169 RepID=UPI0025B7D46B|nr:aminotransferase class V-fold PLP-dependent enzyme [Alicyclobacillus sp.]MCL6517645.1 aminotransferase class V-fold PLP-dependent enzyme [Alicyclobacillus sp.]
MNAIPPRGLHPDEIRQALDHICARDLRAKGGDVWAYVYDSGLPEAEAVAEQALLRFQRLNGLDFTVFPSLLQLENDVVGMVAQLFHPGPETVGTFTSGGTESILLAVKAARDRFLVRHPNVLVPEIILPVTAHAAFHKAAHLLGLRPVVLPVNHETFAVPTQAVADAITDRTAMVAVSAVNYSHGVLDPVAEIASLTLERDVWLHVDACIGGFLLHYLERLGEPIPPFDFRLPGVSSLSVDLHKYAFAPKGASVLLYRDAELRRHQIFACTRWSGYPVLNTTLQSTKSGGPLAGAWAMLNAVGDEGYLGLARSILQSRRRLENTLPTIGDFRVLGQPLAGLLAFSSPTLNLFWLADAMRDRGWYVQVQPGRPEYGLDPSLHLTITPVSERRLDDFLKDLDDVARLARSVPAFAPLDALPAPQPGTRPTKEQADAILAQLGILEGGLPERMADVNALLRVLPPEWTEQMLIDLANRVFRWEGRG